MRKRVDVAAQVVADDLGDVGREDDLEAHIADGPAHDVLGVAIEDGTGAEDSGAGFGDGAVAGGYGMGSVAAGGLVVGWDIVDTGFKIVLSPEVPKNRQRKLPRRRQSFLADHHLTQADIASYIFHSGGPKVLEAMETCAQPTPATPSPPPGSPSARSETSPPPPSSPSSRTTSPSTPATPGTYSILAAMGPAFCSELVLLKW